MGLARSSFRNAHVPFLPLTVNTHLKITDFGVFDVNKFELVDQERRNRSLDDDPHSCRFRIPLAARHRLAA